MIHSESWRDAYAGLLPNDYLKDQVRHDLRDHWEQQEILPEDVVMVAEINSDPVGFIAVWCRPSPFIDNLHVLPSLRSGGIGTALIKAAADKLIEKGHITAYLWVFENNTSAIRFYEQLGAVIVNREIKSFFGYQVPNVKMKWSDLGNICKGF